MISVPGSNHGKTKPREVKKKIFRVLLSGNMQPKQISASSRKMSRTANRAQKNEGRLACFDDIANLKEDRQGWICISFLGRAMKMRI